MISMPPQNDPNIVNRFKQLDIEIDGTLKRGGLPINQFKIKDVFDATDREFRQYAGQKFKRIAFSGANYTASTSDYLVGITSVAVAPSIGLPLPSLVGTGKTFIVKDEVGGAGTTTITIRSEGEKTIDGATSSTLNTNYQSKQFYSDGSNWYTI